MIFDAAILAAGHGTRMRSPVPKMATPLLGEPLIRYPYDAVCRMSPPAHAIFAVAGRDPIETTLPDGVLWIHQHSMDGTLGALEAVYLSPAFEDGRATHLLTLNGDAPLISDALLGGFMTTAQSEPEALWFVSTELADPGRYGRVIRDEKGEVVEVREWVDLDAGDRTIREINAGIYCLSKSFLERSISRIKPHPEKGERFLTSLFALAAEDNVPVRSFSAGPESVLGVNTQEELSEAARILQRKINARWMSQGVTFWDPSSTFIGPGVMIGPGTIIYPGVILEGETSIAEGCRIGPGCHLKNVRVGSGVMIRGYSVLADSIVEDGAVVGPLSHLRPGSHLESESHVGNFVEIKKSRVGRGSKVNHLSYVGDARIGERTNLGAGTITCNYDGANKHETKIGNDVFVGSDTQFVAPVSIGDGSVIGAGSTITKDVPSGALSLSRSEQKTVEGGGERYRKRIKGNEGEKTT
jgi:bifunctional UDP-N-acetylglucosamine pyrophosphorylase/glucosamine-1-phosphate N-acetyltransferase